MAASSAPETGRKSLEIDVDSAIRVSALLWAPPSPKACLVLAHGAGAGMDHPSMESLAGDLAARAIATLRYQFPYMQRRSRRPDPPSTCHAAVRAAVATAAVLLPSVPLMAGGKSFGGRMTSQAQAISPLTDVRGLVFFAFPLHPPKQPSESRGGHLSNVQVPMLFFQGARDPYAAPELLDALMGRLGNLATLCLLPDADHSFHVPARSTMKQAEVNDNVLNVLEAWVDTILA